MRASEVKNSEDAKRLVQERDVSYVKVGVFDLDGVMRGKYMARDKFIKALDDGFGFCDVVLGWDVNDQLYDNAKHTGWHTGYPDAMVRIIPESARELPLENNTLLFLGEFTEQAASVCPRNVLRRVLDKAEQLGFSAKIGCEYEFFMFDETPNSIHDKNFQDLRPITPGNFGYSMLRNGVHADFYHALLNLCQSMNMPLEGLHTETGPGVLEAAITYDDALYSADKAALFKTMTKVLAQQHGWLATFMAKWSAQYPGQSGHVHVSLQDSDGKPIFYDADAKQGISQHMRYFIGGTQHLMPEILALLAPTINSYTRLVPGFWAPTQASWGVENRTVALRVIPGNQHSQRLEHRVPGADANSYLAIAAILASGLYGIDNKIEPTDQMVGNAYEQSLSPSLQLPHSLENACARLQQSTIARAYLGDAFVDHFVASREWEVRDAAKQITDWQLRRYFEII